MFRYPLATVLSSVSIRNLLSTRLFCAPATSTDDQITIVRTTGATWTKEGINYAKTGVYWGDGDPRNNVYAKMHHDRMNYAEVRLRAILLAINQAKKSGLKRVRVQTDFELRQADAKIGIQSIANGQLKKLNGARSLFFETCTNILKLMNEMEVIIEHREVLNNSKDNEVLFLLEQDRKDLPQIEQIVEYVITPKDALSLEGRIVPTVYAVGRLLHEDTVGAFACLWVPESIDHLETKPKSFGSVLRKANPRFPATLLQSQMIAIEEAINEGQRLNIPEIRVVTDCLQFVKYCKADWKRGNGSPMANEKLYLKIKELTDCETSKVHFTGMKYTRNDKWLIEAYEMAKEPEKRRLSPILFQDPIE